MNFDPLNPPKSMIKSTQKKIAIGIALWMDSVAGIGAFTQSLVFVLNLAVFVFVPLIILWLNAIGTAYENSRKIQSDHYAEYMEQQLSMKSEIYRNMFRYMDIDKLTEYIEYESKREGLVYHPFLDMAKKELERKVSEKSKRNVSKIIVPSTSSNRPLKGKEL